MIAATVIGLVLLPLIVLRGRTLVAYFGTDAATWLFAWLLWRRLPGLDPRLAFITVAVLKLATFSLFLANGRNVRWSAARAAVLAGIVYALVIPAMLHKPIDGDEPFYLLVTESMVRDRDLDLANQYRTLTTSETGRLDLVPQLGDPTGPRGEQYSRHEPFLPLLMVPGYWLAGLHGAIATIALFGILLVRSTVRWMEDEGIPESAARAVFPLFAFGPPILFYATRIWPEVPAAFFFVEALRGMRAQRPKRWLPALFGLVMLKLRFVLVAVGVVAGGGLRPALSKVEGVARRTWIVLAILVLPLIVVWWITGDPLNVHTWRELIPTSPRAYLIGFTGLLADGMSGIAFQAPFYLFALIALTRWRHMPRGFRAGVLASLLYLFYLVPRAEWFGGWAPPLRYLVFLMPVLALGIAAVWDELSRGAIALVSAWTVVVVIHGLTWPWRLFHEFTGENWMGEWLSSLHDVDLSRFFPSFVRLNDAAWIGAVAILIAATLLFRRTRFDVVIPLFALVFAAAFHFAKEPPSRVEFEDAHVLHKGGEIYPEVFTVLRTTYRGGWVLEAGDSATFRARDGRWALDYITGLGATIEVGGQAYVLPAGDRYQTVLVTVPRSGRVTLRVLSGAVNVDRMERR